jgi:hypothetical protein
MTTKSMNIYQRINEVRKAVAYLKKDKKVESYMAVTHDAVTALTRDHFVEHGIVIVPTLIRSAVKDTGTTTSKGTPFIRFEAVYRFDVVNADDPQDKFPMEVEAHAIDHGDKAPGKALSYAKKSAVLKLLDIETGEEDEGRPDQHADKRMPEKLVADFLASIGEAAGVEELQKRYTTAYRAATAMDDQAAMKRITEAKDKRKAALVPA